MMVLFKVIVFIVASAGIIWVSRNSLRHFNTHGFYRFFAWEVMIVLILYNLDRWFYQPFSPFQLVSWVLLMVSLFLVFYGVVLLRNRGKPNNQQRDPALFEFEKTTQLVTTGIYQYIRHPLYSSLLFLTWGAFFKNLSWISGGLVLVATFFLVMTAKMEEAENIGFFGEAYKTYMKQSKMFIPFVF